MGFFNKIFGGKPSLEKMQQALKQGNFTEVLHLGEDLSANPAIDPPLLARLVTEAGDGLARRNLTEGLRSLQAGDLASATDHLQLARTQVRSADLQQQIEQALVSLASDRPETVAVVSESSASQSGCGGCTPKVPPFEIETAELPDEETQIELLVANYPPAMQQDYVSASSSFKEACLLIQAGDDQKALNLLKGVPATEQGAVYFFELGCVYARSGAIAEGLASLQKALQIDPGNHVVLDALLQIRVEQGDFAGALHSVEVQMAAGADSALCHARCCELYAGLQDHPAALNEARSALAAGYGEPGFLTLAASLLEEIGELSAAEGLLVQLPGGGCGGGVNLPLAEFWLRQNRELGKILDAFNGACRQEPENPRWQLRVAQTYLARSWKKQGLELLQRVVNDPRLESPLRLEAESLLAKAVG